MIRVGLASPHDLRRIWQNIRQAFCLTNTGSHPGGLIPPLQDLDFLASFHSSHHILQVLKRASASWMLAVPPEGLKTNTSNPPRKVPLRARSTPVFALVAQMHTFCNGKPLRIYISVTEDIHADLGFTTYIFKQAWAPRRCNRCGLSVLRISALVPHGG